ncbi:proline-specific peptidase [Delitschia confertaspora ATCC 74209]|uniref:Proline-specific peptidase n=1 Tax=Delitschia confertaspora ATCC 74209 TaxID=1513339 RepID=A0A9P4JR13_9PLEO|nr:proline-specific peptidase [Delitschia confertaspora ATCC 74209]
MTAKPSHPATEGEIDFDAPNAGKPCKTWYKIVGSLDSPSLPLIILHGGPGATHIYLTPLTDLYEKYGIPIIFYDQVGCGRSTHFQEKMGDDSFWTFDLFYQELDNLIDHFKLREKGFFLLGQSWGGMLGGAWACRRPKGLKKLVLASGPASIRLMSKGSKLLLAQLPPDVRKAIEDCEQRGDFESLEFEEASAVFYKRHVCRLDPMPEDVQEAFKNLKEDPTSYMTMQGPSEFVITGNFKDWEVGQDASNIEVETLLTNGKYDEVTDLSIEPWAKFIPKVKWVTFENSSHMSHYEDRDRFMEVCGNFLLGTSS